jgi:hypothetical protein
MVKYTRRRTMPKRKSAVECRMRCIQQTGIMNCGLSSSSDKFQRVVLHKVPIPRGIYTNMTNALNTVYKTTRGKDRFTPSKKEVVHFIAYLLHLGMFKEILYFKRGELPTFSSKSTNASETVTTKIVGVDENGGRVLLHVHEDNQTISCPLSLLCNNTSGLLHRKLSKKDAQSILTIWGPDEEERGTKRPAQLVQQCLNIYKMKPKHVFTLDGDGSNALQFAKEHIPNVYVYERDTTSCVFMMLFAQSVLQSLYPHTHITITFTNDARKELQYFKIHSPDKLWLLYLDFLGHPQDWMAEIYDFVTNAQYYHVHVMTASVVCLRSYVGFVPDTTPVEIDYTMFLKPVLTNILCGEHNNMRLNIHTTLKRTKHTKWKVYVKKTSKGYRLVTEAWKMLPRSKHAGPLFPSESLMYKFLKQNKKTYVVVP